MQDKLSLTSHTQTPSNETALSNTQSHRHYVSNGSHSSARQPDGLLSPHPKCFITSIPDESLTHITTFVDDPPSLMALSRVNRRFRDHVADDNTWYRAFAFHFLGVGPEYEPGDDKRVMLRRSESTWKKEYVKRFNLARRWERSRNSTLSYQPHYWNVSSMHLLENISLMTANLQYGIVTRSFPMTGKILKGYLDASGTTNGLGIGNPNEEFSPNVSCIALSSCGGTGRIAWGFRNGEVAATSAPRVMDSNRSAARYVRCRVEDEHPGEVRCVLFAGKDDGLVVSACKHGQVKMWDAKRMRCLWTGFGSKPDVVLPQACVRVEFCPGPGVLVAAMEGGDIMVWSGFQLQDDDLGGQTLVNGIHELRVAVPTEHIIDALFVDHNSSPSKVGILVHHAEDHHFLRLLVHLPSGLVTRTRFAGGSLGPITSIKPCFAVHDQTSVPSTLAPLTPSAIGIPPLTIALAEDRVVSREPSFVLAGDSLGTVCVWNWDAEGSFVTDKDPEQAPVASAHGAVAQVYSSRKWEAHDDGAVCAIEVSSTVIVTGSTRGTLKVWDSLTLTLLRSFASPASKPSVTGEWDHVGQIIVRGDLLVASVGSRILVWQAGVVLADKKGKGKHSGKPKGRSVGSSLNKWQQQIELNRDIRESQRLLEDERAHTQRVYGREKAQLSTLDQLGLNEREAVEYLLMLSREEEEQRRALEIGSAPPSSGSGDHVTVAGNTVLANEGDMEGVFTLEEHSDLGQARSTTQTLDSRTLFPSPDTFSSTRSNRTGTLPRTMPSVSNSKVQVSPPFLPEPTEAGLSASPLYLAGPHTGGASPVPMSSQHSSASIPRSLSSTSASLSSSGDADHFPSMSSMSSTPSRSVSSTQLAGSWSRGSPSSSVGSARSGIHPWGVPAGHRSSSASSSTSMSRSPSSLAQSPGLGDGSSMSREEEEDAELKFVLELSLAEARSHQEV